MAPRSSLGSLVQFAVTPRFEVFYALWALYGEGELADRWRRRTKRALPKSFRSDAERVSRGAMMWPLLADSLRDAKPNLTFSDMLDAIASLDDAMFQRAVLSGMFHGAGAVDDLIEGRQTLRDAVETESKKGSALLGLMGLYPFHPSNDVAGAFARIVSEPASYRTDLSKVLEIFWSSAFSDDWNGLESRMKQHVDVMEDALRKSTLSEFSRGAKFPVVFDDEKGIISTSRGVSMFRYEDVREVHVIPSAFNHSRFWGAYADASGSLRLYFPVFDPELLRTVTVRGERHLARAGHEASDPALIFRALGDTTRYAMACVLARSPRTSVELAKEFGVSKATISHHVQALRNAGLLQEEATDNGVVLTLDRQALEDLGGEAARAMFASDHPVVIRRSRHETGRRKSGGEKMGASSSRRTE